MPAMRHTCSCSWRWMQLEVLLEVLLEMPLEMPLEMTLEPGPELRGGKSLRIGTEEC